MTVLKLKNPLEAASGKHSSQMATVALISRLARTLMVLIQLMTKLAEATAMEEDPPATTPRRLCHLSKLERAIHLSSSPTAMLVSLTVSLSSSSLSRRATRSLTKRATSRSPIRPRSWSTPPAPFTSPVTLTQNAVATWQMYLLLRSAQESCASLSSTESQILGLLEPPVPRQPTLKSFF